MSATIESMRQKIERTEELGSVVRTMKALAASSIGQYEDSVHALSDYYRTVLLGLSICLGREALHPQRAVLSSTGEVTGVVVFGSDQGLVGQFNEALTDFVANQLEEIGGEQKIWAVGERIYARLLDDGLPVKELFHVPNSVEGISPLLGQLLQKTRKGNFYLFHNRPRSGAVYEQAALRLLPLDRKWILEKTQRQWITGMLPEVIGDRQQTLSALIREYLFVTMFKACAESLAAENASRLAAMQRAEKNIGEMLEELHQTFHRERQNAIDEELFDIIAGFEALGG